MSERRMRAVAQNEEETRPESQQDCEPCRERNDHFESLRFRFVSTTRPMLMKAFTAREVLS